MVVSLGDAWFLWAALDLARSVQLLSWILTGKRPGRSLGIVSGGRGLIGKFIWQLYSAMCLPEAETQLEIEAIAQMEAASKAAAAARACSHHCLSEAGQMQPDTTPAPADEAISDTWTVLVSDLEDVPGVVEACACFGAVVYNVVRFGWQTRALAVLA